MNVLKTQKAWLDLYQQLEAIGEASHDSQSVAFGLLDAYDKLSAEERADICPVLAEWFVSENNKHRYDAAFLTSQRRIRELAPAVAAAIDRLWGVPGPEARDEVEHLRRIHAELAR